MRLCPLKQLGISLLTALAAVAVAQPGGTCADTVTGGLILPITWVHDAVGKDGKVYFAAESSSVGGGLFRLENESTATRLGRFAVPCLSFGFTNDTFFVGMGSTGRVLKSTSGGVQWDTTIPPPGVASVYRVFKLETGALWIATGNTNGDVFEANYKYTTGGAVMAGPTGVAAVRERLDTLYSCTNFDTAEVWRSTDHGLGWSRVNRNFPGSLVYDIFWDAETAYVGLAGSQGLQRTTDRGRAGTAQ